MVSVITAESPRVALFVPAAAGNFTDDTRIIIARPLT
jgi:hypothetical protein